MDNLHILRELLGAAGQPSNKGTVPGSLWKEDHRTQAGYPWEPASGSQGDCPR